MNFIRTASFGELFTVTFVVAASFQIAVSFLGALTAVLSPGLFTMNGAPATSPLGALGVLVFLLLFALAMNAAISALGAITVLGWRRFLPRSRQTS